MLSINRINGTETLYANQNKQIPFKSKIFPNEALKDALYIAEVNTKYATEDWRIERSRYFAKIVDYLLNDGKNDLIKVTRSQKGSTLIINGKRVNFYREENNDPGFIDGERVIGNIVDYFTKQDAIDLDKLTRDEFKSIKPAIDTLNSDLNADDAIRNLKILYNLERNIDAVHKVLKENTLKLLDNLESKIFNK